MITCAVGRRLEKSQSELDPGWCRACIHTSHVVWGSAAWCFMQMLGPVSPNFLLSLSILQQGRSAAREQLATLATSPSQ